MPVAQSKSRERRLRALGRGFQLVMICWLVALLAALVWVASYLRIDYFDSFAVLNNARQIAGGAGSGYDNQRPVLLPVLLSLLFPLEKALAFPGLAFTASHVIAVGMTALMLLFAYRLIRLQMSRLAALAGAVLLSSNTLLIHSAPFTKEDVPAMLFATAGFFFYLKARLSGRLRLYPLAGLLMAATMSMRFNLLPMPILVIGSYELVRLLAESAEARRLILPPPREMAVRLLCLGLLPSAIALLLPSLVFNRLGLASLAGGPALFRQVLVENATAMVGAHQEGPGTNVRFLIEAATLPVLLCAGLGLATRSRLKDPVGTFCLLWFAMFFGVQSFAIGHKEARYLLAVAVPLAYFAAGGVDWLVTAVTLRSPLLRGVAGIALAVAMAVPTVGAAQEASRFLDPVYSRDYERSVSLYSSGLARGHQVFWVGTFYSIHPAHYVFDQADDFAYVYDFWFHVIGFWSNVRIQQVDAGDIGYQAGTQETPIPGIGGRVRDGDILVGNPIGGLVTSNMESRKGPIVVERVRVIDLEPSPDPNDPTSVRYTAAGGGSVRLREKADGQGYLVSGQDLADGPRELYGVADGESNRRLLVPSAEVKGGRLEAGFGADRWPLSYAPRELFLLRYEPQQEFWPPNGR